MRHVHVHVRPPQVNGLEKMLVALVRAHGRPGLQTVGCRRLALISLISIRKCKVHRHICMCDCAHIPISIRGRKVLVAPLLATTYHLPPTTYHLPPTTYRLPPTTYHLPPTTYHLLPNTDYFRNAVSSVLATHHWQRTPNYPYYRSVRTPAAPSHSGRALSTSSSWREQRSGPIDSSCCSSWAR